MLASCPPLDKTKQSHAFPEEGGGEGGRASEGRDGAGKRETLTTIKLKKKRKKKKKKEKANGYRESNRAGKSI
jgi:hypothetical protein